MTLWAIVFALGATSVPAFGQDNPIPDATIEKMDALIDKDAARVQDIYKDIHEHAELALMETRTAGVVARELRACGFDVKTGIGVTGVVGIMRNGEGPVMMFRADMDALSIEEESGLPYASKERVINRDGEEVPVSHMCGHDAHTTWLIGLGKVMSEMKDEWSGTLVLVAQPAEETIEGARAMLDDGLYTTQGVPEPDYYLALHTIPVPIGYVLATSGRFNTGTEHIDVTFHGIGGHGSSPHHAKDPVVMAGLAIVQYQTIVSRIIDPLESAVLTIGAVHAGIDNNVIPTEATLKLKLHYSSNDVRDRMVESIINISNGIAESYDVSEDMMPTIVYKSSAPPVVNTPEYIDRIHEVLGEATFVENVYSGIQVPGSDDAGALVEDVEGVRAAYLMLGTVTLERFDAARAEGKMFPFSPHEPVYAVDLDGITYGTRIASLLVLDVMAKR
jgi:hippurate hydrolase